MEGERCENQKADCKTGRMGLDLLMIYSSIDTCLIALDTLPTHDILCGCISFFCFLENDFDSEVSYRTLSSNGQS